VTTLPPSDPGVTDILADPIYFVVGPVIDRETWISANLSLLEDPTFDKRQWLTSLATNIEALVARAKAGQL